MCGRYVRSSGAQSVREQFGVEAEVGPQEHADWRPRFNVAPGQWAPVVRVVDARRQIAWLRWGLVPPWAHADLGQRSINARAETVGRLPSFRAAFRARRCVVPADAFYEWQAVPGAKHKQPWCIRRRDGALLAMAGLWEHWQPRGAEQALESFSVITTQASGWMAPVHARMPAILDREGVAAWLQASTPAEILQALLCPAPEEILERYPVGQAVGNPRHEGPQLIEPVVTR